MKDLAALGRCYNQNISHISHKPKSRTLLFKQVPMLVSTLSEINGAGWNTESLKALDIYIYSEIKSIKQRSNLDYHQERKLWLWLLNFIE